MCSDTGFSVLKSVYEYECAHYAGKVSGVGGSDYECDSHDHFPQPHQLFLLNWHIHIHIRSYAFNDILLLDKSWREIVLYINFMLLLATKIALTDSVITLV